MTNSDYTDGYSLADAGRPLDHHRAETSPSYAAGWHDSRADQNAGPARQEMLFAGLDCLPGQLDLFPTDGTP